MLLTIGAQATTVSFVPASDGAIPTGSTATFGGIVIDGFVNTLSTPALLWGRNDNPTDHGLGVCSEGTSACSSGGGDVNELSNERGQEILRLTLPTGYSWVSVGLSSLDKNDSTDPTKWERGKLFGGNNADGTGATELCDFVAGATVGSCLLSNTGFEPNLGLTAGNNDKYLFFIAQGWGVGANNTNNDYLVRAATITNVPEPTSMLLLGSGLVSLAGFVRRKINR